MRFARFDHDLRPYERPHADWTCGQEDGPCRLGPDANGTCRPAHECLPRKVDDRWQCMRPAAWGAPCEDGPCPDGTCSRPVGPCIPRPSHYLTRTRATRRVALAAVGLLAIALSADTAVLSPGPLTTSHAIITDCGRCHATADAGPAAWLAAMVDGADPARESARCQACHGGRGYPLAPHGSRATAGAEAAAAEGTAAATETAPAPVRLALPLPAGLATEVACSVCHREHAGPQSPLPLVNDDRCQPCHAGRFGPDDTHARIGPYAKSDQRISFDHRKHFDKHYPESKQPVSTDCGVCHAFARTTGAMVLRPAEETCSICHRNDFASRGQGLPVLSVPGLDLEVLRSRGAAIGAWPAESVAPLAPLMEVLLAADPEVGQALAVLKDRDLLDLTTADTAEIDAVVRVAWAIKSLFAELVSDGPSPLGERLERAVAVTLDPELFGAMFASLPREAVVTLRSASFPDLTSELARHRAGESVPLPAPTTAAGRPPRADAVATPRPPMPAGSPPARDDDLLTDDLQADDLQAGDLLTDDLLTDDLLTDDLLTDDVPGRDLLIASPPTKVDTDGRSPENGSSPLLSPEWRTGPGWLALGGWQRVGFVLAYRPTAHRDLFMRAWLEAATQVTAAPAALSWDKVAAQFSSQDALSKCSRCHIAALTLRPPGAATAPATPLPTVGAAGPDASGPAVPAGRMTRFNRSVETRLDHTVFSHRSHLPTLGSRNCLGCHPWADPAASPSEPANGNGTTDACGGPSCTREFQLMGRQTCGACHADALSTGGCVLCHRYHGVDPAPSLPAPQASGPATQASGPATQASGPATQASGPATQASGPATSPGTGAGSERQP